MNAQPARPATAAPAPRMSAARPAMTRPPAMPSVARPTITNTRATAATTPRTMRRGCEVERALMSFPRTKRPGFGSYGQVRWLVDCDTGARTSGPVVHTRPACALVDGADGTGPAFHFGTPARRSVALDVDDLAQRVPHLDQVSGVGHDDVDVLVRVGVLVEERVRVTPGDAGHPLVEVGPAEQPPG